MINFLLTIGLMFHPMHIDTNEVRTTKEVIYVEATFYTAQCTGCIGITKTGYDVRKTIYTKEGLRHLAVDPKVIPLNSILKVELENGMTFAAIASDIGGSIKGKRIDVLVSTKKEAFQLGRQKAKVTIIEYGMLHAINQS